MDKPHLLIVTGMPGAGKTTLARALGDELCMPVVSRDRIKAGYVHTMGRGHDELPPEANLAATDIFFDALRLLVSRGVSAIAEAAFQHRVWAPRLEWFLGEARVAVLVCRVEERVALERYLRRGMEDGRRAYFHGDAGVDRARRGLDVRWDAYEAPRVDAPTYEVDTLDGYRPSIRELRGMIWGDA